MSLIKFVFTSQSGIELDHLIIKVISCCVKNESASLKGCNGMILLHIITVNNTIDQLKMKLM